MIPPPPRWMNACCRDMGMFQVVMPVGKRDCELLRAVQTCVRRRSGPSCGPAQPSPWEGRSVDVPPGSQPGGQSWGVRRILRSPPPLHASRDMLQMLTWEEVARKPGVLSHCPPRDYLHLAGGSQGRMCSSLGWGLEKLFPGRRNTSVCSCGLAAG